MDEKIKQLKEEVDKISKELDELIHTNEEEKKNDFSKWIGRCGRDLCIFGKNGMLITVDCGNEISIAYNNVYREIYNSSINYEVIEQKDLKFGDVFIGDNIKHPSIEDFDIYMGKNYNYILTQYLDEFGNLEVVNYSYSDINPNQKVKRFIRE